MRQFFCADIQDNQFEKVSFYVGCVWSLNGHSKQLKQLCRYLIGWGLCSCLSQAKIWLGLDPKIIEGSFSMELAVS